MTDKGTGLKSLTATLSQGGADQRLALEQFSQPVGEHKVTVALVKVPGVKEGPAVLRVTARDASLWRWFKGNETVLEKNVTIDITPPTLDLVADDRYVNFGGVGVIVYKPSPDTATSGVKMGNYFFPGFAGQIKDHPDYFLALFAHPYNAPPDTRPTLVATDKAGNTREMRLAYELKNVKYTQEHHRNQRQFPAKQDRAAAEDVAARQGTPKESIHRGEQDAAQGQRRQDHRSHEEGDAAMLWKGAFAQLSNSKVEANFAD